MDASELQELFNKYIEGTASMEEEDAFLEAVEQQGQQSALKQLLDRHFAAAGNHRSLSPSAGQAILKSIFRTGSKHGNGAISRIFWMRMAVAASVLAVLATGWWLFSVTHKPAVSAEKIVFKSDRPPGSTRATLTLADGAVIALDSVGSGSLAQQGNTHIMKLKEGQLAYQNASGTAVGWNTITTPNGGHYEVVLPDGTNAWLNAGSTIRFPTVFNGATRTIDISGEVFLEVAQHATQPFMVNIDGRASVKVLGTSFNINAYANEPAIITTVLSGSVKMARKGDETEHIMQPGEQSVIGPSSMSVSKNANTAQAIAWKSGYFYFDGMELQAVMRQLERWYNISVVYKGNIPDKQFWGELPRNLTLQQLVKLLRFGKIALELNENRMTIIGN